MNEIIEGLWISDIADAREKSTKQFDHVVTVCQDSVEDNVSCEYDHFMMADGPATGRRGEHSYDMFWDAAMTVLESLEAGKTVLVHCHVGRSRSAAICIAVLGVYKEISYPDAISLITDVRYVQPDQHLAKFAKLFIEQNTDIEHKRPFSSREET